jgi:hypothetical protein
MNTLNTKSNLQSTQGHLTLSLIEQYDHVKCMVDADFQTAIACLDKRDDIRITDDKEDDHAYYISDEDVDGHDEADSNNNNKNARDLNNENTNVSGNHTRIHDSLAYMSHSYLSWSWSGGLPKPTRTKTILDKRERLVFKNLKMIEYIDSCLKANVADVKSLTWRDIEEFNLFSALNDWLDAFVSYY